MTLIDKMYLIFFLFVKGPSKDCSGNILSREFTKEGKESLLEALNDVRRTIAYGEQDGQPSAANMKKVVGTF